MSSVFRGRLPWFARSRFRTTDATRGFTTDCWDAIDVGANDAYAVPDVDRLHTVVETPAYLKAARGVLSDALRASVVNLVAENPEAGVPLGGGVRKVRIARPGRGKSGGARVVFLFTGEELPVFLLTVFAKNEKANLTVREMTALIAAAKELVADYRRNP